MHKNKYRGFLAPLVFYRGFLAPLIWINKYKGFMKFIFKKMDKNKILADRGFLAPKIPSKSPIFSFKNAIMTVCHWNWATFLTLLSQGIWPPIKEKRQKCFFKEDKNKIYSEVKTRKTSQETRIVLRKEPAYLPRDLFWK